jgi:hypothetical protein
VLTIGKLGASRDQLEYYERQVAAGIEDYYAARGEAPGWWIGGACGGLGLEGRVDRDAFMALMHGRDPIDGTVLRRMGACSTVAAVDLTFSALLLHHRSGLGRQRRHRHALNRASGDAAVTDRRHEQASSCGGRLAAVPRSRDAAESLGEIIRRQRELSELSMRRFAQLAGISNPYLSQIERGTGRQRQALIEMYEALNARPAASRPRRARD